MTHTCVDKLTITGSDNGLSPGRRQAIIRISAGILLIGYTGTNFSGILIEIQYFSLKKIRFKISSVKCCPFRLGLNVFSVPVASLLQKGIGHSLGHGNNWKLPCQWNDANETFCLTFRSWISWGWNMREIFDIHQAPICFCSILPFYWLRFL